MTARFVSGCADTEVQVESSWGAASPLLAESFTFTRTTLARRARDLLDRPVGS